MPGWGSYSYAFGPTLAVLAITLLLVYLRRTSRGGSLVERAARPGAREEYGLMIPVAQPSTAARERRVVALLANGGIRYNVVGTSEGRVVMVWAEDVSRARQILDDPPAG